MTSKEEIEAEASEWIRSQGWSEETLSSDEYGQMVSAYVAAAMSREERIKRLEDECDSLKLKSDYITYMEQRIELSAARNHTHRLLVLLIERKRSYAVIDEARAFMQKVSEE